MSSRNIFNEATRVQMPALVHLNRLGYNYFGKISEEQANIVYDPETNILIDVFKKQFATLNPDYSGDAEQVLKTIRQELDNDDLGRSFYKRLTTVSPVRLVDFTNSQNNVYHCTAEFTCKRDQDEFRPDITLFVNGLPLVFIEVKKPNNPGGMVAESTRMNKQRFPNKKFRRFINITQFMIFSNNMEYDTMGGVVPIQGAFYCTASRDKAPFNCFREENPTGAKIAPFIKEYPYKEIDPAVEKKILTDFNCQVIHTAPEYQTNLDINTPTNRIITSMCSPERLLFLIKYGIAYVKSEREVDGKIESTDQKHIMRYQQMFATLAIRQKLSEGVTSGVVWHTQGSGKTALSYHLTYVLSDYFAQNNKVAKFYFIVDRLDLLEQATQEFEARGLVVKTANSRQELMEQFRNNQALEGSSGNQEITVVNIQRFAEDKHKVDLPAYATNLQRVFILDTFQQVLEDPAALIAQMQEVRQTLFEYSTDNAEEFSSEISTIEDKTELLKLKKALIAARDCCNMVRTFGDAELKAAFAALELPKLSQMISEVQHHIDAINQKEAFSSDDTTKLLVNEAMQDITFNFSKIGEEEMKLISGGVELQDKWQRTIRGFTQNIDQDDPEFITLREAFMQRFKEHGFVVSTIHEFEEHSKALDEVLKKLAELQKKNNALLKKYNGDEKFARVHKRIREENTERQKTGKAPIVSLYDESIMSVLLSIKNDIDQKVYDRNDILKKDAYFEKTVMTQIKEGMDKLNLTSDRADRLFIQSRITRQYLNQYNATYPAA